MIVASIAGGEGQDSSRNDGVQRKNYEVARTKEQMGNRAK